MPEISVLVIAYNVERYISRCLDSILGQSCHDIEIVVVDDGSSDGTGTILKDYAGRDQRVRVVSHPENKGTLQARKTAINASKGKYIMFVDGDDTLKPYACERLLDEARRQDADFVVAGYELVFPDGSVSPETNKLTYGSSSRDLIRSMVFYECTRYLCGRIFERRLFTEHPYEENRRIVYGEDQLLSYHTALYVRKAVSISDIVFDYYQHPSSLTNVERDKIARSLEDRVLVHSLTLSILSGQDRDVLDKAEFDMISFYFRLIKKNRCGRRFLMRLVRNNSLAGLLSIANLRRYLGLRKALVYWAVFHIWPVAWVLYGRSWND